MKLRFVQVSPSHLVVALLTLASACTLQITEGSQRAGQRCFQDSDCGDELLCLQRVCTPEVRAGDGVNNGANNGANNGFNNGENNGFNNGVNNGFNNGVNNGFNNGVNNGFNNGVNNGEECRIGARRCVSDVSFEVCVETDDGSEYVTTRCGDAMVCRDGRCIDIQGCTDNDGDGYGPGCDRGDDCNDRDASVFPNRPETCGNMVDDNCNGAIDEGCNMGACCPNGCADDQFCTTQCVCEPFDPLVCQHQSQPCDQEGAFFNGFYCFSFDGISQPRCWGICDINSPDPNATCPDPNSVCAFDSGDGQNGICMGACVDDPATGTSSCPPELGCMNIDVSDDSDGVCTPTNPANGPGDSCNVDSFWDCVDGYVCVDIQGNGQGRCREACRPYAYGVRSTATDCNMGHCLPFSASLGICFRDNMATGTGQQCSPQYTMCNDDALTCYPDGGGGFNGTCYRACRRDEGDVDCENGYFCSDQFDPGGELGICSPISP